MSGHPPAPPGLALLALSAADATASAPPAPLAAPGLSPLSVGMAEVVGALLLVLALVLVTLGLLRRLAAPSLGPYPLKVLGSLAVGPRERLVTVAVADVILVLGVGGGGGVRKLHTLPGLAQEGPPPAAGAIPSADGVEAFAARLGALRARPCEPERRMAGPPDA